MGGEEKYRQFYISFFKEKGFEPFEFPHNNTENYQQIKDINFAVIFNKSDIHSTEDHILEIKEIYPDLKFAVVFEKKTFTTLDTLYTLGTCLIIFDFEPENILNKINQHIEKSGITTKDDNDTPQKKDQYIINFYENKGIFFIDLSGTLSVNNLKALKLMFKQFINPDINKIKAVLYIFNNTDENSFTFQTTWALFRFWDEIGIPFKKINYLTISEKITDSIHEYLEPLGVSHQTNLIEVVKHVYPEFANKSEIEIFEYASDLLHDRRYVAAQ